MRRVEPHILVFIVTGAVLLLALLGGGAGVASFLLLRAGYSFLVWGLLPVLMLLLVALVLGGVLWWAAGGALPGIGRHGASEERPHGGSPRRGPRRGDDV
jgi:hypothetical protein